MPELPDIHILAESLNQALVGRHIDNVSVHQPKCLNLQPSTFRKKAKGRRFEGFKQRGKWILAQLDQSLTLALNLGMGGDILLHNSDKKPNKEYHRVVIYLNNKQWLGIHHWWFGHVHLIDTKKLDLHPQIGSLGIEPLDNDFTVEKLEEMLSKKRGRIKSYLLNQRFVAGIGNVYIQDILWRAKLHPERPANTLGQKEIRLLHSSIQKTLREGIKYGGGPKEQDVWGNEGRYMKHRPIGYRTGEPCPTCGATIEELRVGQTTSYICPQCQAM